MLLSKSSKGKILASYLTKHDPLLLKKMLPSILNGQDSGTIATILKEMKSAKLLPLDDIDYQDFIKGLISKKDWISMPEQKMIFSDATQILQEMKNSLLLGPPQLPCANGIHDLLQIISR